MDKLQIELGPGSIEKFQLLQGLIEHLGLDALPQGGVVQHNIQFRGLLALLAAFKQHHVP